ncbi:MAG: HAMP domain-containing protein [Spirochaetes bacterium]|nr:HAMP domain-containing protein [Spirochaetota bacterium]
MPFYITYYSVGHFIAALASAVIGIYILTFKKKSAATYLLAFYTLSFSLTRCAGFLLDTMLSVNVSSVIYFNRFFMLGGIFLAAFAYLYHRDELNRESRIVLSLTAVYLLISYIIYIARTTAADINFNFMFHSYRHGGSDYRGQFMAPALLVMYLWICIVFARKTIRLSTLRTGTAKKIAAMFPRAAGAFIGASVNAVVRLVRASEKPAKASRSFMLVSLIPLAMTFSYFLAIFGGIPYVYYETFISLGSILYLFFYVMVYINNSPEPTTLLFKITFIPLVVALGVVGVLSIPVNASIENVYEKKVTKSTAAALAYVSGPSDHVPADVLYIVRRPANEGDDSTNYADVFLRRAETSVSAMINNESHHKVSTPRRTFRALDIMQPSTFYLVRTFVSGGFVFEVGLSYIEYREYLHDGLFPFILIAVVLTAIMLILFPIFFYRSLLTPLNGIMHAIEAFDRGEKNVRLAVAHEDEFGRIAGAFNRMTMNLKRTMSELVTSQEETAAYSGRLSKMVDERTKDLIATNKRLIDEIEARKHAENVLEKLVQTEFLDIEQHAELLKQFGLTGREVQVLVDLLNGLSNRDIADRYGIAEPTAKVHTINIYRKFKVNSRARLIKAVLQLVQRDNS